ncbi:phage tail sheath family protein [Roseibacillus persicicus]|uniref:phage tail sheath family protein n=1 Tax=Roseibacillus persicicus TaxID=454148 RepID=UPI00280F4066|nr:hypothetical protein [Roseibacillus persicicus]MDQ8190136.1 hypothetical protein [Roseibacillus persicicus]
MPISIAVLLLFVTVMLGAEVPTSKVAVVGRFAKGPIDLAVSVDEGEFDALFAATEASDWPAEIQVRQFFRNGGSSLEVVRVHPSLPLEDALAGDGAGPCRTGLGALLPMSDLGILLCPELTLLDGGGVARCLSVIESLGEGAPVFTVLDPPPTVASSAEMIAWRQVSLSNELAHAALYYPRLSVDPATWTGGTSAERIQVGASGTMAAVIQKSDETRGIWKSVAGSTATLVTEGLDEDLSSTELDALNVEGINSLRNIVPYGTVAWGARTLSSDAENRYLSVARTRRWILRSLVRDLASEAALAENDFTLWASLESRAESFLNTLYRSGAFAGATTSEAYFARCDSSTMTINDVNEGRVNLVIGTSFLRPAEFAVDQVSLVSSDGVPGEPDSALFISRPFDGQIVIGYRTVPGFDFTLELSLTMEADAWFGFLPVTGDGAWVRVTGPASAEAQFFRVQIAPGD